MKFIFVVVLKLRVLCFRPEPDVRAGQGFAFLKVRRGDGEIDGRPKERHCGMARYGKLTGPKVTVGKSGPAPGVDRSRNRVVKYIAGGTVLA